MPLTEKKIDQYLDILVEASQSISDADLIDKQIYSHQKLKKKNESSFCEWG